MILRRLGNKAKIAPLILPYFPKHDMYIELFAGAGGMFFSKPQVKYNFLNDIDEDIYNLWQVVQFQYSELVETMERLPLHEKLWKEYKKVVPEDKVFRACLFLMYSNFGLYGKPNTLKAERANSKEILLQNLQSIQGRIKFCTFLCCDFRDVLKKIALKECGNDGVFIYADPPYLSQTNNYSHSFTEQDTRDLFALLAGSGIRFALSEFGHPLVLRIAEKYGLNVITIGERQTLGNRRTELLITNYENNQLSILE